MKILKCLLFLVAFTLILGCSSDDDGGVVQIELTFDNLTGTYEVVFFEGSEIETDFGSGVLISTETFTSDTFTNAEFTFSGDGTFSSSGSYRIIYTTTINGQAPVVDPEIESFDANMLPFSFDETSRTMTLDSDIVNVTFFDGNSLHFTYNDTEIDNGNLFEYSSEIRMRRIN